MARRAVDPRKFSPLNKQEPGDRYRREHDGAERKEWTCLLAVLIAALLVGVFRVFLASLFFG